MARREPPEPDELWVFGSVVRGVSGPAAPTGVMLRKQRFS
jgi:hypothetical protein